MNKDKPKQNSEMREEYDFSEGVRGKYVDRIADGSNVVVLDPDIASFFPTSKDVNDALRTLVQIATRTADHSKD